MAKNCPERNQNHKLGNNSANMSIWSKKNGPNFKTNRHKHFNIHFKHSNRCQNYLFNFEYMFFIKHSEFQGSGRNLLNFWQNRPYGMLNFCGRDIYPHIKAPLTFQIKSNFGLTYAYK